ncbi:MAG: low molecular weight phosphatase family protein [bacterium]|nr:low molecular weight phosphatase family protein [bacterium]
MKILFVCKGNVARSQMAEAYYNYFTKSKEASSAGVLDFTPLKYGHPIKEVVQVMQEDNIDVSKQTVKYITQEMVDTNDKIFIMCQKEESPKFLLESNKVTFWSIADPFDTSLENFRRIKDEIKRHIEQLIQKE